MPMFLHIGFFHLLANSFGLFIFGGMVERIFGSVAFAAIYLVAGVLGKPVQLLGRHRHLQQGRPIGAGASGAVFGIVGAFGSYLLLNRHVLGQMGRQAMMVGRVHRRHQLRAGNHPVTAWTTWPISARLVRRRVAGVGHSPHAKRGPCRLFTGETHGIRADPNAPSRHRLDWSLRSPSRQSY